MVAKERVRVVHGAAEVGPVLQAQGEVEVEIVGMLIECVQGLKLARILLGLILPILPKSALYVGKLHTHNIQIHICFLTLNSTVLSIKGQHVNNSDMPLNEMD